MVTPRLVFEARQAAGSPGLGTPPVCGHSVVAVGMDSLMGTPEQPVPVGVIATADFTVVAELSAPPAEIPGLWKVNVPATAQVIVVSSGS